MLREALLLGRPIYWALVLLVVVSATSTPRQVVGQRVIPAPEPLYEWEASHRDEAYFWDAALSFDGSHAVVRDGKKIFVVNTKTKKHQVVYEHTGFMSCWTCPQTGGLFVVSFPIESPNGGRIGSLHIPGGAHGRLDYLAEPKDWLAWEVTWSLPVFYGDGLGTQFLEESNHLVVLERERPVLNKKGIPRNNRFTKPQTIMRLIDRSKLAADSSNPPEIRIQVDGLVGGLEWVNDQLFLVYASRGKGDGEFTVRRATVNLKTHSLDHEMNACVISFARLRTLFHPKVAKSNSVDEHRINPIADAPFRSHYFPQKQGNRVFRFRGGPAPGDLDRLVERMQVDPTFYSSYHKYGTLEEHMSTLGDRMLISNDPRNPQPIWYLDNTKGATAIADVVPTESGFLVLTIEYGYGIASLVRRIRVWQISPTGS